MEAAANSRRQKCPSSYVALKVHTGTRARTVNSVESYKVPVKITDTECEPVVAPNNASTSATSTLTHPQLTTEAEGAPLGNPVPALGAATLCLASAGRAYTTSYKAIKAPRFHAEPRHRRTELTPKTKRTRNAETTTRTAREATEKTAPKKSKKN